MARVGGPDGDDRNGWGCASVEPIAGTVQEGLGGEEGMPVGGSGGDLAFACGFQSDGEHSLALAFLRHRFWAAALAACLALQRGQAVDTTLGLVDATGGAVVATGSVLTVRPSAV
jgi:hypothetical protein